MELRELTIQSKVLGRKKARSIVILVLSIIAAIIMFNFVGKNTTYDSSVTPIGWFGMLSFVIMAVYSAFNISIHSYRKEQIDMQISAYNTQFNHIDNMMDNNKTI